MSTITLTNTDASRSLVRYASLVILLPALLIVGCVSISTDGGDGSGMTEEDQKHTFAVSDNPTINVTGFNGAIEIVTGRDGEVDVEATLRIPHRVSYSATLEGNTVTVVAKKVGSGITIGRSPQAEIRLVVPARSTITARTSNGRVNVDGVTGDGILDTSNGRITVTNVIGTYTSSTSNGSVKLSGVEGQFRVETSNGRIEFAGILDPDSNNSFTTSNGSIDVVFNDDPSVELDARTSNGTVDSDRPILATTTQKNRLVGKYGDGSASLHLRTSNGSIDIR
jgi:hypothetical protein